jgi:hypothetical protein
VLAGDHELDAALLPLGEQREGHVDDAVGVGEREREPHLPGERHDGLDPRLLVPVLLVREAAGNRDSDDEDEDDQGHD